MNGTKSPRIFENRFLETVSRSHPVLNTAAAVALAAASLALTDFNVLGLAGATVLGVVTMAVWTLIEYLAHRFFFHWTPRHAALARALYLVHQYHHDFPLEKSRNMFPLVVGIPMAAAAWLVLWTVLPWNSALFVFAVLVLCFAYYDLVHYQHHLTTPWLPILRRRHMLHHFRAHDANFGVTTSFWDRVFGSLGPEPRASSRVRA